ncbi:MAG: glycosyltransferase family 2 protein [Nitrososphaerota archaeon]|nr:glycosyltransferase family 2 protein [Candidatus Bathyarchaeota archaeon]MDW8049239.1 glycosyltransferase family 2 protein [Nitrososphaerota archaeon]
MNKIDVVMLTKNSQRWLEECVRSVYANIPVNRLIVIDGYSTDGTLTILKKFDTKYGNVKIIQEFGTRGKARNIGIREVETDWFMFVDSDVILCDGWFNKAWNHVREDTGAVWGADIPGEINNNFLRKVFQCMETRVFAIRGGCQDTLIRYDAVKDIKIPEELHTLEDAYIKEWILSKGFRVVVSFDAYCKHFKEIGNLVSRENRLATINEFKRMRYMQERMVYAAIFAAAWFAQEASRRRKN